MDAPIALDEAIAILERTPATVRAILADLPEEWAGFTASEGSWSSYEILGHLIEGERTDWVPRTKLLLTHGAAVPFTPFDRTAMLGRTRDLASLLDTFEALRADNLRQLADLGIGADELARTGLHPELGEVTLSAMLAAWAVHDLSHVAQMTETMAKRYREHIGPWRAYLPVVDRDELPS